MTGIIYFVAFIVVCAIVAAIVFVMLSIVAERRAEARYSGDPDAFFEKERQDTDKYDIPALPAKMKENKRGGGLSEKNQLILITDEWSNEYGFILVYLNTKKEVCIEVASRQGNDTRTILKALKPKTAREIADSLKRTADKAEEAD